VARTLVSAAPRLWTPDVMEFGLSYRTSAGTPACSAETHLGVPTLAATPEEGRDESLTS